MKKFVTIGLLAAITTLVFGAGDNPPSQPRNLNVRQLTIGQGTGSYEVPGFQTFFKTDPNSGMLSSYDAAGNVTSQWNPLTGMFSTPPVGGVNAANLLAGTVPTNVLVTEPSLPAEYTQLDATVNVTAGDPTNPPGSHLSFGISGSVNGIYGLWQEDCHALGTVYGSEGLVVGAGRQDHSHDGSLWIASKGVDSQGGGAGQGAPAPGSQETRIYTDEQGTHFQNNYGIAEQGMYGSAFNFDDDLQTSGTLRPEDGYLSSDGSVGITASVPAGSSLQVENGLIVGFTPP